MFGYCSKEYWKFPKEILMTIVVTSGVNVAGLFACIDGSYVFML